MPLPMRGQPRTATLEQFLASTSVAVQTIELGLVRMSRRTVLQYIANRRGGVHFDPRRDLTLRNAKKRRKEAEYHLLDHGLVRVGHLRGPEFEVMSMVGSISETDWSAEIVRVAERLAPDDFNGDPTELKFWTGMSEADGTCWATSIFQPSPAPAGEG